MIGYSKTSVTLNLNNVCLVLWFKVLKNSESSNHCWKSKESSGIQFLSLLPLTKLGGNHLSVSVLFFSCLTPRTEQTEGRQRGSDRDDGNPWSLRIGRYAPDPPRCIPQRLWEGRLELLWPSRRITGTERCECGHTFALWPFPDVRCPCECVWESYNEIWGGTGGLLSVSDQKRTEPRPWPTHSFFLAANVVNQPE